MKTIQDPILFVRTVAMLAFLPALLAAGQSETKRAPAPLFDDLGRHHHPVTTPSKLAQRYFDQGLTLCFNFNHNEAIRSFHAVATLDPDCAMAWWGVAFAYGPNINVPMDDKNVPKAWEALQKAVALRGKASARERDYIDALAKRYVPDVVTNRAHLDRAFADAMRVVAKSHPEDLDAQSLFAESLMDTSPWDYWQEGNVPKPNAREAIEVIESVLKRVRQHPGADHLYIHLTEAGPNPELAEKSADRLARFAPGAGHLVHMPSHTYVRVGRYHDASTANERASLADESYLAQCRQQGMYPGGYYPHNVHFLWFATDLEGRSADSIKAAKKVSAYTTDLRCGAIEGPRQRYLHLLAFARYGKWDDILAARDPGADYPFDRAMWHYARGLALAAKGRGDEAAQEHAKFLELERDEKVIAMDNSFFPGTKILAIADNVLAGKVAWARGRKEEAIQQLREGVKRENAMPYMEPPFWYYPVRESLGAVLLKVDKPAEAETAFREVLKHFPESGRALHGIELSLRQQGRNAEAKKVQRRFKKAWKHADTALDLSWF
jgi:tetratricopeptide (TPR) repeat protein